MTKEAWARVAWESGADFFLEAHGVKHFRAPEICPVGRKHRAATLYAPSPDCMLAALRLIEGPLNWIRSYQENALLHVNSWYRSPEYNKAVGGGENSMHLTGGAADVQKGGWSPLRMALALHNDYPLAAQLGIGVYATFLHVDVRGMLGRRAPARWSGIGVGKWWLDSAA